MKVCSREDCSFAGEPQPDENFYRTKYECRTCTRKAALASNARNARRRRNSPHVVDRERKLFLAAAPWRAWLDEQIAESDVGSVAAWLGVSDRMIWRWQHESERVALDAVDKALCSAGRPWVLRELWPDLYRFEGAA